LPPAPGLLDRDGNIEFQDFLQFAGKLKNEHHLALAPMFFLTADAGVAAS
jgi:hypothetical protein